MRFLKIVFLLFIIFFSSVEINSQNVEVQRKFMGYVFYMHRASVERILAKEGYDFELYSDFILLNDVEFGGRFWNTAFMEFYNNQFFYICFDKTYNSYPSAKSAFNLLNGKLSSKYPMVFDENDPTHCSYYDGKTYVFLQLKVHNEKESEYSVSIGYFDNEIALKKERKENNEF